jgi:hypothetical protein
MTEDEAKTKWCPFARTVEHGGAGTSMPRNRVALISTEPATVLIENLIGINCIGSACMAFRWEPQLYEHHSNDFGKYINSEEDTNRHGVKGKALPRHGFCGLAGRP